MNDEAQGLKNALRQNVPLSDEFGDKTYYILITIDLAEQKAVGVKFCDTHRRKNRQATGIVRNESGMHRRIQIHAAKRMCPVLR
jgi:hypothetical protein